MTSTPSLPRETHVVVGAGIIGTSTAFTLATDLLVDGESGLFDLDNVTLDRFDEDAGDEIYAKSP